MIMSAAKINYIIVLYVLYIFYFLNKYVHKKIKIDENLKIFNCIPINLIEPPEKH